MKRLLSFTIILVCLFGTIYLTESCSSNEESKTETPIHQKSGDEEIEPNDGDEVEAIEKDEETQIERKIKVKIYCKHAVTGGWDAYGMDSTGKWYIVRGRKTGITATAWGSPMPPILC